MKAVRCGSRRSPACELAVAFDRIIPQNHFGGGG
jgi:hypothetical protein